MTKNSFQIILLIEMISYANYTFGHIIQNSKAHNLLSFISLRMHFTYQ